MKRTILFLLCTLLTLGVACIQIYPQVSENTPEPIAQASETPVRESLAPQTGDAPHTADAPEPTEEPSPTFDTSDLPKVYNVYNEVGLSVSEAEMFCYDIDFDGEEEHVSFRLDEENDTTTILFDDEVLLFDISAMLNQVVLVDLDPATPWVNLLVEIDWGSDDYVTTEVHLEDGKPVKGAVIDGISIGDDGRLIMYERSEFLGTRFGHCGCAGEALQPDSEWYEVWTPSENELSNEREELIEFGDLVHTVREIPCTINGKPARIAKDTYLYVTRFNPTQRLAEVCTPDGVIATIAYTLDENDWPYLIDGVPQDDCFDNIMYSD